MSPMDWNRSQMNLNAFPPWQGGAYTANSVWHPFGTFQPSRALPMCNPSRRGSLNKRYSRRSRQYSSDEDETDNDLFAKSKGVSPVLSRQNQRIMASDSEEETQSRKSDRRSKRRSVPSASREPSPALSRRGYRKKYDDDDDAMSIRSVSSRRSGRSSANKQFYQRTRPTMSDSDDELTSENGTRFVLAAKPPSRSTEKSSESPKSMTAVVTKPSRIVDIEEEKPPDNEDWECEHCTYLNMKSSKVCDVCCKSRFFKMSEQSDDDALNESMKDLNVEKKKGKIPKRTISFWLGTKVYS